ncbi:hypothetical protein [Legionella hackeliae]|uniref:hypothetical protein n=1 Tax=Legionella hackeliae TaxID=449 RepID=UPI00072EF643|nr:hypothetical protein [Legionella hackeliae]KTD09917.1 hypothetical protein Lhac_2285 [Legionella hackeliae]
MLVSRVYEFIEAIKKIKHSLDNVDKELLHAFQEKFPSRLDSAAKTLPTSESLVTEEEIQWLQERFAQRWDAIADKPDDYTFDPRGKNAPWVLLAKELAQSLKKPYLMILIPKLSTIDPEKFSRLEQDQDPRSIYLSDDGKTWHRIQGLFERLQQPSAVFSTYDLKKIKPRALTLREMFRIRSKKGEELAKEIHNETYANFWDYIIRRVAPTWQQKGKCPDHLLPQLLEVVELYFSAKASNQDLQEFKKKLKNLIIDLETCPLEDINHFYGIEIYGKEHNHYLVDVLLDCFEESCSLEEKLADVARWLCSYDPTLVSKCKNLIPVYKILKVGEYFDVTHLSQLLAKLDSNVVGITPKVQELIAKISTTGVIPNGAISKEIILEIRKLYALRWQSIKDTPNDYLRKSNEENRSWIRLAQYLAGAGYIEPNYYKLLIPTLTLDIDPITREIQTNYPLTRFILSEDEKELIYLPNCIGQHQSNGTFYHFSGNRFRTLTSKELERLPFAESQFYEYYAQFIATEEECLPIKRSTVMALKDLVNGTLNPYALRLGHNITKDQERIAEEAYFKFFEVLNNLPSDELARLYAHTVIWRGQKRSVHEILKEVQLNETPKKFEHENTGRPDNPDSTKVESMIERNSSNHQEVVTEPKVVIAPPKQRECIALASQYFLKLVCDYAPDTLFTSDIHNISLAALEEMRLCSAQRVFRDWDNIDDKEATRRALTILVALITHNFSYLVGTSTSLQFWDQKNSITATGKELFKALEYALENGDFSKIRFIYTYRIRNIVAKALAQKDIITSFTRYEDTLDWLKSIKDESMFDPKNQVYFDPEILLAVLTPLAEKFNEKSRLLIEGFLDQLVKTRMQSENQYLQWVRINVEFNKLLNNKGLPLKTRDSMLSALRSNNQALNSSDLNSTFVRFLTQRLASIAMRKTKRQGIFDTNPGQFGANYHQAKEYFEQYVSTVVASGTNELSISEIVNQLKTKSMIISNGVMMQYLESITKSIPILHSGQDLMSTEPVTLGLTRLF